MTMHIVASSPTHLSRAAVPAAAVEKEREVIRAAALAEHAKKSAAAVSAGKPALPDPKPAQLDKLVDGKLKKWMQEQILLEQPFVVCIDEEWTHTEWEGGRCAVLWLTAAAGVGCCVVVG